MQSQPTTVNQQAQQKETIKIITDQQQLMQLLNNRQALKTKISTLKPLKLISTSSTATTTQAPKVQLITTAQANTQSQQSIVSVLPATIITTQQQQQQQTPQISQTPILIAASNPQPTVAANGKIQIQPLNKYIAVAPQPNNADLVSSAAKKIKIENPLVTTTYRPAAVMKPLAPKSASTQLIATPTSTSSQTTAKIVNKNPPINILVTPNPVQTQTTCVDTINKDSISVNTILYSTDSQSSSNTSPSQALILTNDLNKALNETANNNNALTKKQFRMMKNRESACLSRKRKKEVSFNYNKNNNKKSPLIYKIHFCFIFKYMQNLEEKLKEIFIENQKLKTENNSLKEKITTLQNEVNLFQKKKIDFTVFF